MRACRSSAQQGGEGSDEASVEDELAKLQEMEGKGGNKKPGAKPKTGAKPKPGAKTGTKPKIGKKPKAGAAGK